MVIEDSAGGSWRVKVSPELAESGTAQFRSSSIAVFGPAWVCLMLTLVIALSIVAAEARVRLEAPMTHARPNIRTAPMMATRRGNTLAVDDNTMDSPVRFPLQQCVNAA